MASNRICDSKPLPRLAHESPEWMKCGGQRDLIRVLNSALILKMAYIALAQVRSLGKRGISCPTRLLSQNQRYVRSKFEVSEAVPVTKTTSLLPPRFPIEAQSPPDPNFFHYYHLKYCFLPEYPQVARYPALLA